MESPCDWNLILDADEYLVSGTKEDILKFAESGKHVGAIERHDSYREANGEISQSCVFTTRLMPRGTFYEGKVHEQVVTGLPIAPLPLVFEHDGYLQGGKGERNLEILLEELAQNPQDPYVSYIYNLLETKKYEKGFQVIADEKQRLDAYADYHFACGTFYTQAIFADIQHYIGYLPEIERSYRRCLEIGEVPEHEGVLGNGSFKAAYNLGVWFEVNGKVEEAAAYYKMAAEEGYYPAKERLKKII